MTSTYHYRVDGDQEYPEPEFEESILDIESLPVDPEIK